MPDFGVHARAGGPAGSRDTGSAWAALLVPYLGDAAPPSPAAARPGPTFGGMEIGRRGLLGLGAAVAISAATSSCRGSGGEAGPGPTTAPTPTQPAARPGHVPGSAAGRQALLRRLAATEQVADRLGGAAGQHPRRCTGPTSPRTTTRPISSIHQCQTT